MRVIRAGGLRGRLPVSRAGDEYDRLAINVNDMLDELERLVEELRIVGDGMAHDLRTPLARARARLEGARNRSSTPADYRAAIDEALVRLDQTSQMIAAVLRIGEIEHGRRCSGFASARLGEIAGEAVELYAPLAEERGIALRLDLGAAADDSIVCDRDLVLEAVANLLDNAIKFAPECGNVEVAVARQGPRRVLSVTDDGPGIEAADRARVVRRFFRGEQSRHDPGHGLGLALVNAVATLHGFELRIADRRPGCEVAIHCDPHRG